MGYFLLFPFSVAFIITGYVIYAFIYIITCGQANETFKLLEDAIEDGRAYLRSNMGRTEDMPV